MGSGSGVRLWVKVMELGSESRFVDQGCGSGCGSRLWVKVCGSRLWVEVVGQVVGQV